MNWQITAVDTEQSPGHTHEHISDVFIKDSFWLSRDTVVQDIRNPYGDDYFTMVRGHEADVIVVSCPVCAFRDYLRTKADGYNENNLLSLPRRRRAA
jgi:hypothetical protein